MLVSLFKFNSVISTCFFYPIKNSDNAMFFIEVQFKYQIYNAKRSIINLGDINLNRPLSFLKSTKNLL